MLRYLFLFLLPAVAAQAQMAISLKSKRTAEPVAYANIWKENKIYASSDSLGVFMVDDKHVGQTFRVSAIGFVTISDAVISETTTIFIDEETFPLDDIRLVKMLGKKKVKLGKIKNPDVFIVSKMDDLVPMVAKYFPNDGKQPLFIDTVKFKALSSDKNRIVAISLFTADADGKPSEPINTENIICHLKKGNRIAAIDLKNRQIPFPENGIFVVINYLQLEQNKHYGAHGKDWFFYEPSLNAAATQTLDTWYFGPDGWKQNPKYSLSMQLVVTN